MSVKTDPPRVVYIFSSYAQEDYRFLKRLESHLSSLKRLGRIENWYRQNVKAGSNRLQSIEERLRRSDIILLLISPDFIMSDTCYESEMKPALEQHASGKATVIPIILRPTEWHELPFASLQSLPGSAREGIKPVTKWKNLDEAFVTIVRGLRIVIDAHVANEKPSSTAVQLANEMPSLEIARPFWHIPYARNNEFIEREHVFSALRSSFTTNQSRLPTVQILRGVGGSGKTQIALEYAYRYADAYQAVFWLAADSRSHLNADLLTLADLLHLPERLGNEQEVALKAVLRWFDNHDDWLLIFDNIEDTTLIDEFVPRAGRGDILVTSRQQVAGNVATTLELEQMMLDEGALLLLRRSRLIGQMVPLSQATTEITIGAREIAELLGRHPLAIEQAGAYIAETQMSIAGYRQQYALLLDELQGQHATVVNNQSDMVMATFLLSLKAVEQSNPAAIELVHLCAFLHPDAIPEELLIQGSVDLGPVLSVVVSDPSTLRIAIQDLVRFSLVAYDSTTQSLSLHRLLQTTIKSTLTESEQRQWRERAVCIVNRAFPLVEFEVWPRCQRYLPHALLSLEQIEHWNIESSEVGRLLQETGFYLYEQAQYSAAVSLLERALTVREHVLGPEHPDTAATLNTLGELARKQERYTDAAQLYQRALAIREHVLGPEHPDAAVTLNALGELHQTSDDFLTATKFYQRALMIRERALGLEDRDTIRSIGDLAGIYDEQRDYQQAEPLYVQALTLSERASGPEHPDTALALSKLARFYRVQQKYEQAEVLFLRSLAVYEKVVGADHPSVATVLNNLAYLYRTTGRYAQAERLLKRAIAIWEQVLGPEHSNTATSLSNLARVYSEQGDYLVAEPLYQRVLAIRERQSGREHADTAESLINLANLYQALHRPVQAEPLYQRALGIYQSTLGADHPDTLALVAVYTTLQQKSED